VPSVNATALPRFADPERIAEMTTALADFGREGPTAVNRIAFTPVDEVAHTFVERHMRELGLETRVDAFGNVFGRRAGDDPDALPVMTGSHLDGPPAGGMYDGTIGVVCALEAVRVMNDLGIRTRRPIDVAAIRCEHLDRFGLSCLGSRALSGKLQEDDLDRLTDILVEPPERARTLREVLRGAGHLHENLESVRLAGKVHAFLELHIEQGKVLEERGERLGIVTGIAGPTRFNVTLEGSADHSGGTPMSLRHDALCGAAEAILALERIAESEPPSVGTVGVLSVSPGAVHTIVGEARFRVDIRGVERAAKQRVVDAFTTVIREIAERRGLELTMTCSVDEPPVPCSPGVVEAVAGALADAGMEAIRMPSGGGHDAQHMAHCTDAAMIFVPSAGGISHTPDEHTSWDDLAHGATAVLHSLIRLAGEVATPGDAAAG
jgi:N-carbamoyl-L-amino-acid hydrolase